MNHNSVKYFLFSIFFTINLYSQNIPKVPETITLDNMVLRINNDAKSTIQSEVDALHANDKYFQIFIDRINIYFPIIENVLNDEGVPDDFKYLALQESALIPDAVSSSNAIGFWQFKLETAEQYGLVINDNIDERKNIVSSTRAAARYIKNSNFTFENWVFSVLSYLLGLNGAKSEVDSKLYGTKRMSIDSNTHWYIIKFLGYKIAFENYSNSKNYNDKIKRPLNMTMNINKIQKIIPMPKLNHVIKDLVKEYDQSIYLHITRGVSDRDHDISIANEPTVFAMSRPIRKNNLYLGVKAITHDDIRWQYCDIKATTLLSSVLLRHKAKEEGSREAILVRDGFVTEGAASNIFIHLDDKIYTPPKTNHVLPGITRDLLIEILLDYKIPLKEEAISVDMLSSASEIWLTSSTWEIVPVVELNGNLVGEGNPGPLWKEDNILYLEFNRNYCN